VRTWLLAATILLFAAGDLRAVELDRLREWEERMLDAVNDERVERGLPRYRRDRDLDQAAADHALRMAESGRVSHQLPREPDLRTRLAATGLRFDAAAENVGYSTRVETLHDNLMRSRGHRENLLASRYDAIGIAIYRSGGRYYVTQNFARTTSRATSAQAVDEISAAVAARKAAADPDAERMAIGVCHRSSRRYPAGVFWVALSY
jgi:uncharacterized protein YkwD